MRKDDRHAAPLMETGRDSSACRLVGRSLLPQVADSAKGISLVNRIAGSVGNACVIHGPAWRGWRRTPSGQLFEQRLGVPKDRHVEAFGEPAIPQREEVAGFPALALVAPQASEAGGGTQPKSLRVLAFRQGERSMIILLRGGVVASRIHHIASRSMQLDFTGALVGRLDELRSLGEAILTLLLILHLGMILGEKAERGRRVDDG